jgi:anti-anti-sigma factor
MLFANSTLRRSETGTDVMQITCGPDLELETASMARLTGRMEARGAAQGWDVLSVHVTDKTPSILVDMEEVELFTSAGVGMLVSLLRRTQRMGGAISVFTTARRVRAVLTVVMMDPLLNVRDTEDEARECLRELGVT